VTINYGAYQKAMERGAGAEEAWRQTKKGIVTKKMRYGRWEANRLVRDVRNDKDPVCKVNDFRWGHPPLGCRFGGKIGGGCNSVENGSYFNHIRWGGTLSFGANFVLIGDDCNLAVISRRLQVGPLSPWLECTVG